ncbi:MAG: ribonuclease catalytic domain-containing protein [Lentisphaeria bacterium]|jgi:exoribonuclease-2
MAHPLENRIVDFLDGDQMRLARVVKGSESKLQGEDAAGRGVRIAPKLVLADLGPANGAAEFARAAEKLAADLAQQAAGVEPPLLWEIAQEEPREWSPAELAQAWFSSAGPREQGALVRALLPAGAHFKRNGFLFTPRSTEELAALRLQQQRRQEREERIARLTAWLRATLAAPAPPPEPTAAEPAAGLAAEPRELLDLATSYILGNQPNEATRLLATAFPKRDPRESGLELLGRFNRLPPDADPFLLRHGIVAAFPAAVEDAAAAIPPFAGAGGHRRDLTHLETFSIDDATTREIDDALSLEPGDGGRWRVGIHIADPAAFIHRKDPLDQAAFERTLTLYLPTSTVTMLPHRLGCGLASLNAGELRPALSFLADLDADGTLHDFAITRSQIRVRHRLTYDGTDRLLAAAATTAPEAAAAAAAEGEDALAPTLRSLHALAERRRAKRNAAGALQLNRVEVDAHVEHGEITLSRISDTPARLLVSEFMILANHLAAVFALRHDLPFIFRSQEAPAEPVPPMTGYDPVLFSRIVKTLNKSRLSTQPLPHAGLGLDLYTQISSPLRRYADLVLQRQLAARLAEEPLPYTALELIEVLAAADETEARNRQLERQDERHWILEFLRRQGPEFTTPAVALGGAWIELAEFGQRARLAGGSAEAGERFPARIERCEPRNDLLLCARVGA